MLNTTYIKNIWKDLENKTPAPKHVTKIKIIEFKDLKNNISHAIYSVNTSFNNLDFIEDTEVSFGFISRNKWGEKIIESQILGDGKINFANLDWEKAKIKDTSIIIKFFKEK